MDENIKKVVMELAAERDRGASWGYIVDCLIADADMDGLLDWAKQAAGQKEGWKLVPLKPTKEMIEAGAVGSGEDSESVASGAWEAMIAASPPDQGQG